MALYGAYVAVTAAQWKTLLFTLFYVGCSGLSVTAGAHRLWSHRSYKAKLPLRTLLMLFNCMAGQNDIYDWVRDHRVHHKYSETDADPHNVNRGVLFRPTFGLASCGTEADTRGHRTKGKGHRLRRRLQRPRGALPDALSHPNDDPVLLHHAYRDPPPLLGRGQVEQFLRGSHPSLGLPAQLHVAGEQRRAHLGARSPTTRPSLRRRTGSCPSWQLARASTTTTTHFPGTTRPASSAGG
uniref:Putative fatty acid desaturase n=1 Tax=Ixodes ricinus TaxID=34613 RepID=V5IDH4_IXORI